MNLNPFSQEVLGILKRFIESNGIDFFTPSGQILRPLISFSLAKTLGIPLNDNRLINGALSVQIIHEASLKHDDILDNGTTRRNEKTQFGNEGIASSLIAGDKLIAESFKLISKTDSLDLIKHYSHCNLETIRGEILQQKMRGKILSTSLYEKIIIQKTGMLFSSAASIPIFLSKKLDADKINLYLKLFERIGALYQMLDDLLDYVPSAKTGKTPFQDFLHKKWSFSLIGLEEISWEESLDELQKKFLIPLKPNFLKKIIEENQLFDIEQSKKESINPFSIAKIFFLQNSSTIKQEIATHLPDNPLLTQLIASWEKSVENCQIKAN